MEKEKKGKVILIASGARCLSTVFIRVAMQLPNIHFIVSKLPHFAIYTCHLIFEEKVVEKFFDELEKEIDENISQGKTIIW